MKISAILDQIDIGAMALPEFQRGYVWNRAQVRGLMQSLYQKHPVGGLLVWVTTTDDATTRGEGQLTPGVVNLLLDGQQRITSLYGIIRGRPPEFFDGDPEAFTGLYFNLKEPGFEFYAPAKMSADPFWINVTTLMQSGVGGAISGLLKLPSVAQAPDVAEQIDRYTSRLASVVGISAIELHIEQVTGEDKSVDVVVDIFNRVNSGGTKLSKGDLALARICAKWPEARDQMKVRLTKWKQAGYHFRLDWLLRNINAIMTGEAQFAALADVETAPFKEGLDRAETAVDTLLDMIAGRLGLDHGRVLGGPGAFPLMARYLSDRKLPLAPAERDRLLYWYVHSFLWGRYSGSTETVLNVDLSAIEEPEGALERLIAQLRRSRGDLRVNPNDFVGWSKGARFYPMLYLLTRVGGARDLESGLPLSALTLGAKSKLEVHHVFPKALLYKHGYSRPDVNAIANFTFLTMATNKAISDRDPALYLAECAAKQPSAVESHWIPMDPDLWQVERYRDFLAARRELLAEAANGILDGLLGGTAPTATVSGSVLDREPVAVDAPDPTDDEERVLAELQDWLATMGLPPGEELYDLVDPATGGQLAVLDLAWPLGIQYELREPVAVLLNEPAETMEAALRLGFRPFTSPDAFRAYVSREILGDAETEAAA